MKSYLRKALVGGAAALTVMTALPSPAFAINHADCTRDYNYEFLHIMNYPDEHCFANAGTMGVSIYGVGAIWTGNNNVAIEYIDDLGGSPRGLILGKRTSWHYGDNPMGVNGRMHKVYKITIV